LLLHLRTFKYKDVQIEFGERLRKAEAEASNLPPPPQLEAKYSLDAGREQRFRSVAEVSPNYAVFEAWLELEQALRTAAKARGLDIQRTLAPLRLMQTLRKNQVIDQPTFALIDDLRVLRNLAVHPDEERPITLEQAERYQEMAKQVLLRLQAPAQ